MAKVPVTLGNAGYLVKINAKLVLMMTYYRRHFIRQVILAAAAGIMSPSYLAGKPAGGKLPAIGFISGIVNNFLKEDWKGTLAAIADMGYTEMEGGWNLGGSPAEMTAFCKSIGLRPFAGGMGLTQMLDQTGTHIDKALECGNEYLVCYWPWLDGATNITAGQCRQSADILNKLGEMCKKSGIKFCWHNHDKEFLKDTGEGLPFELLMQNTDPELVSVELDIYWVKKGGADPLAMLKKYPGRYSILHVKDMNNEAEKDFACPGTGIIDFGPLFREAIRQGIAHFIVERDGETDGIRSLQNSAQYLTNLSF